MKTWIFVFVLINFVACSSNETAEGEQTSPLQVATPVPYVLPEKNPFGLNIHNVPFDDMQWDRIAWFGVGWVRMDILWWEVHRSDGVMDWNRTDGTVIGAIERGLDVMAILTGTPPWVMGIDQVGAWAASSVPPDSLAWQQFVQAAARRYKPGGELALQRGWPPNVGVHVWEVWNEPDLPVFWGGNASTFRDIIWLPAIRTLRAETPESKIALGGLCCLEPDGSDPWPHGGSTAEVFSSMESVQGLDIFSLHYYPRAAEQTVVLDPYRETESWLRRSQGFLDRLPGRKPNVPIWLTETGFSRGIFGETQQSLGIQRMVGRVLLSPTNRLILPESGYYLLEKFFIFNSISQDFGIYELNPIFRPNAAGRGYRTAIVKAFEVLKPDR